MVDTNATIEDKTLKGVGMDSKTLKELISKSESQNVEFKQSALFKEVSE